MSQRQSIVLCEGYHDRAFWSGWLRRLGCVDPASPLADGGRTDVLDPWGKPVRGGDYGFRSKSGEFVRVRPCHGCDGVMREARRLLSEESKRVGQDPTASQLSRLVIAIDPDTCAEDEGQSTGFRHQDLQVWVRKFDPAAARSESDDFALFQGVVSVSLVRWETGDAECCGFPGTQCLERLVCAALVAACPTRGPAVQDWLDSRPDGPPAGPKEFSWSHMAGWYAEHGCQEFYSYLWAAQTGDGRVREELEKRLRECGAWRIAEALAQ
jgi:hypothetical protein